MTGSLKLSLTLAATLVLSACGGTSVTDLNSEGGSTPTPGASATPPSSSASFAITMDAASVAPSMDLRDAKDVSFTVTAFNGFSGAVTVTANGLPAGVAPNAPTQTVTLTQNGTSAGKFTLTTDNKVIGAGTYPITLDGSAAGAPTGSASVSLTVNPVITLQTLTSFPVAGTFNFWDASLDGAALGAGTEIHMGNATAVTVQWKKMFSFNGVTTTGHRIHGSGTAATGAALVKDGSKTIDANGALDHSDPNVPPPGSSEDLTGAESGTPRVFVRILHPAAATAKTVVDYYDHQNGGSAQSPTSISGRLTIYEP